MTGDVAPRPQRILLIAYEYPPSPSPQSLRWAYLSRELSRQGHHIEVLTIDLGGTTRGLPAIPDEIVVHRTWPGPFRGLVALRRKLRHAMARSSAPAPDVAQSTTAAASPPSRGGWSHRVSLAIQNSFERLVFPDLRGEWYPSARRELQRMLGTFQPELVISSHEPATTLQLGLIARRTGVRWVADLGDPVLAPYTRRHWRNKARRLESAVCHEADHILVTAESARRLLHERHRGHAPISVLTQGFDDRRVPAPRTNAGHGMLELLYTGSFYSFRRVDALLDAVIATPGVRLNIASIVVPDIVREASQAHPDRIRLLGFLPHDEAVAWQQRADVLVNLANSDPAQVPGKCYEYLGSGRPILHLGENHDDAAAQLILERHRGWVCPQQTTALTGKLRELVERHGQGRLIENLSLDRVHVAEFGWSALGLRLAGILDDISRVSEAPPSRADRPVDAGAER